MHRSNQVHVRSLHRPHAQCRRAIRRRSFAASLATLVGLVSLWATLPAFGAIEAAQPRGSDTRGTQGPTGSLSVIVGRPTETTVTLSILSSEAFEGELQFGERAETLNKRVAVRKIEAGVPTEVEITGLKPATRYVYRLVGKPIGGTGTGGSGSAAANIREDGAFQTKRSEGGSFVFCVQGDSHPERLGKMFHPALYERTLRNALADKPDFYFMMGDDFSIERLIERGTKSQDAVNSVYALQRGFLGLIGREAAIMLVNGNHEQAAKYLLDGTANNFAILAGRARINYFPLPNPVAGAGVYTGNTEAIEHLGSPRDYYAWEWGDALFVVIDPYWHSEVAVDNEAGERAGKRTDTKAPNDAQPGEARKGGGKGQRDLWRITLGEKQYRWLSSTLRGSDAKFKFVFSHHVLGTGRGGIEQASKFEWGGKDNRGIDRFFQMRPTWDQPIHDLMRDAGVTIFFQGHDHLYAQQELDGVIYQSCPNPADDTFTAFNRQAYKSGVIHPNSGHLRVTVSGGVKPSVKVEYVRSRRPQDETESLKNASIVHEYTLAPRAVLAPLGPAKSPGPAPTTTEPTQPGRDQGKGRKKEPQR